eukprot:TRINITY_DN491_c0_g1_i1.p1 TRINITY_DN491_c0_g1~~TRINITY_DN491_c0_g1_i1.p1  ORF type:complete len:581 (-),score=204.13 TRINITY_DN491_c0_g1_i1:196-1938(-)
MHHKYRTKMKVATVFVLAFAFTAVALASSSPHVKTFKSRVALEHDADPRVPPQWVKRGPTAPLTKIKLHFAIKQQNTDKLTKMFHEVSDPKHANYAKYVSIHDITDMIQPHPMDIKNVQTWLAQHGVTGELLTNRDMIVAYVPAKTVEQMLSVKLFDFHHSEREEVVLARAEEHYTVPAAVAQSLDFVDGVSRFPSVRLPKRKEGGQLVEQQWPNDCQGCEGMITPGVLKERYNITGKGDASSTVHAAVAEFQGQFYSPQDLSSFFSECSLPANPVAKVVGPNQPSFPGTESTLDIEYIMGVATDVPTWFWSLEQYSLSDWVNQVSNHSSPPLVHSVSYGNDEVQNGRSYMERTNEEFKKAGLRGISILFASGDQGVYGRTGPGSTFHPDFPGGSPYITAVGGTQFPGSEIGAEIGTNWSGGGFSGIFKRTEATWQDKAVQAYFSEQGSKLPPQSNYDSTGRGYPDIAANDGNNQPYCILQSGQNGGVAGTSASCPTAAGIIALVNQKKVAAGKQPLGFLNPWIYQLAESCQDCFFDVVQGNNNAGGPYGFNADQGWDPVTGNGNPNYAAIEREALKMSR